MFYSTPAKLLDAVVDSRNRGDLEKYLSCYEPAATIVLRPGVVSSGHEPLREVFTSFTALRSALTVRQREFVEGGEIALHLSEWTLNGIDTQGNLIEWNGRSCDVVRKQSNGGWLLVLDNPWGTSLLD